jgi:hypothetical protein
VINFYLIFMLNSDCIGPNQNEIHLEPAVALPYPFICFGNEIQRLESVSPNFVTLDTISNYQRNTFFNCFKYHFRFVKVTEGYICIMR